jgi:hypothetical protein
MRRGILWKRGHCEDLDVSKRTVLKEDLGRRMNRMD